MATLKIKNIKAYIRKSLIVKEENKVYDYYMGYTKSKLLSITQSQLRELPIKDQEVIRSIIRKLNETEYIYG